MTAQEAIDFRIALTIVSVLLACGLILLVALIGIAVKDEAALRRTRRNGVLRILADGAIRRHLMVFGLTAGIFVPAAYRAIYGVPAIPAVRIGVVIFAVVIVLAYAVLESMDRWKLGFYFREDTDESLKPER